MLTGKNFVCVSTISWDFLWQGHQAISSILARSGNRVLFIENTGVRAPGWQDRSRIAERLRNWASGRGRFAPVAPNIFLYSPLALPFPYSPLAQRLNRRWICESIERWLRAERFEQPILLSFLPTQFTLDLMDTAKPAVSVFYSTDRLSQTSPAARRLVPYEKRVLERCDLVFASASKLAEHCRRYNPETHIVTTGVSLEKFEAARRGEGAVPADLSGLRRPLIGHIGGLRKCVDQELLEAVGKRLPGATFVLVGPEQVPVDALRRLPNFKLLGSKPHETIPAYIREFDVCLIPYVVDEFTDHISPAKLNEYLALGKPVVSTGLFEVRRFAEGNPGIVAFAEGPDDFAAQIERALCADAPDLQARRTAAADANSWDLKVEEMSARIESKLHERARRTESVPPS
jgi:glycosyltransferase involved in cell wall biosynthesis